MPHCAIHCDFHPGNLKYENNRVVGIFDFDWSKIDLRLFDLRMAVDDLGCRPGGRRVCFRRVAPVIGHNGVKKMNYRTSNSTKDGRFVSIEC